MLKYNTYKHNGETIVAYFVECMFIILGHKVLQEPVALALSFFKQYFKASYI